MIDFAENMELYLKGSILISFAAAFAGGVFTGLTPCLYPMIPVTAGVIGTNNVGGSRLRGFSLSLIYVTGMALTYAGLGMVAALTGRFFGEIGTNPVSFVIMANVVIFMGLGMLDVFHMPSFSLGGGKLPKGYAGVFLTGVASGLVAGPCTAPVLGVLLAYVSTTRNIVFGGSLLWVFAFGMGLLLLVTGTFSGAMAAMPRSGEWMVRVKKIMGFLMIGLGEYYLIKAGQLIF